MADGGANACESCGAPRGTPHEPDCAAEVENHFGEAEVTITIEED